MPFSPRDARRVFQRAQRLDRRVRTDMHGHTDRVEADRARSLAVRVPHGAGRNVGLGTDYTIYALIDGVVKFEHHSKARYKVSVYPRTEATTAA